MFPFKPTAMKKIIYLSIVLVLCSMFVSGQVLEMHLDGHAVDSSSNGLDGTINNAIPVNNRFGVASKAMYFNGVNSSISTAASTHIRLNYPLSIGLWVWIENVNSTSNKIFVTNNDLSVYSGVALETNGGKLIVHAGNGAGTTTGSRRSALGSTVLNNQEWYHVVVVLRGATDMSMFINGVAESLAYSGSAPEVIGNNAGVGASLGAFDWSASQPVQYFKGAIDELRVWDYALSESEAQSWYLPGTVNDLGIVDVLDVRLDVDFDGEIRDSSTHSNTVESFGGEFVNDRFGNSMNAYYFDGVDDRVLIANDASYQVSYPVSISMWIWFDDSSSPNNKIFVNSDHGTRYSGVSIQTTTAGKIAVHTGDASGSGTINRRSVVGATTLQNEQWYHLVAVLESATAMTLYLNGEIESGTKSGTSNKTIKYMASTYGAFGGFDWHPTNSTKYFKGAIDDMVFYHDALTSSDVDLLYTPGTTDDLFTVTTINSSQLSSNAFIFPNPAKNIVNYELPEAYGQIKEVRIINIQGRLLSVQNADNHELDLSGLPSGNYMLEFVTANSIHRTLCLKE